MGWRLLSRHIAVGQDAAMAFSLTAARRAVQPPRPPAWAAAALRRRPAKRQTRDEAAAAPLPHVSMQQPVNNTQTTHQRADPMRARRSASAEEGETTRTTAASSGIKNTSFAESSAGRFSSLDASAPPQPQHARSEMRSHTSAFDSATAPPPNSYAYVHGKRDSRTKAAASATTGTNAAKPASTQQTLVSVEGEDTPIAAAPGAVRRALQQRHASKSESDSGEAASSSTGSALHDAYAHLLTSGAPPRPPLAPDSSEALRRGSAALTPAERQARRVRQRRTRDARERRRLARDPQRSGSALHPCRLQGGCQHSSNTSNISGEEKPSLHGTTLSAAVACPYRHYPADYCLSQLRSGSCGLHEVGCCPWRHDDLSEGNYSGSADRGELSSDAHVEASPSGTLEDGAAFTRVSPLAAMEADGDVAGLQRSAWKVGQLLRLCVDAVAAAVEEAAPEHRHAFLMRGGPVSLTQRWAALRDAQHAVQRRSCSASSSGISEEERRSEECLVRMETAVGVRGEAHMLSVPADLAWCAMTPTTSRDAELEAGLMSEEPLFSAAASPETESLLSKRETAPLSRAECAYWSSFFTLCECTPASELPTHTHAEDDDATLHGIIKEGEAHPAAPDSHAHLRLRLTPCVSAWVVDAAAAQMQLEPVTESPASAVKSLFADEGSHDSPSAVPAPTSAALCFEHATLYLLGWRWKELQQYLSGTEHPPAQQVGVKRCFAQSTQPTTDKSESEVDNTSSSKINVDRGTTLGSHSHKNSPQWAPVLLLRDLLMASNVSVSQGAEESITEEVQLLFGLGDKGSGTELPMDSSDAELSPARTRNSLLSVFLSASARRGDPQAQTELNALVRRGAQFTLQSSVSLEALPLSTHRIIVSDTTTQRAVHAEASTRTARSTGAVAADFDEAWADTHRVLLHLQWGLLHCPAVSTQPLVTAIPAADGHLTSHEGEQHENVFASPSLLLPSAMALTLYLQPALLHLVTRLATVFAAHFEAPLREAAGWQPWTDAQLFTKAHEVVYNAAAFARHHLPVVRLGLHNSLLNALLLLVGRHTATVFGTEEPSEVRQLLLRGPAAFEGSHLLTSPGFEECRGRKAASHPSSVAVRWWAAAQQSEHRFRQQHLQPAITLSLGVLTALQDLSRQQLTTQQSLMQTYEQRRAAYANTNAASQDHHRSSDTSSLRSSPGSASTAAPFTHTRHNRSYTPTSGSSRTRKYHSPSQAEQEASQRARLAELRGAALLDRLLPYGSATVSPDAAAYLLRHLLEGGHPYKALKLAASIVHASRMLRHADKQPRPVLQPGLRTVHTRVWSKKLLRHVLVKKRVPVLRLVGDVEDDVSEKAGASARPEAPSRRGVRPVGLSFVLSPRLVEEMARVGLRMGEAGALLVDGVQQDCLRGALVDFNDGRALPVPTLADVDTALHSVEVSNGEDIYDLRRATSSFTPAQKDNFSSSSSSFHRSHPRNTSCAGELLRLLGVAGSRGTASPSFLSSTASMSGDEEDRGAPHRRIAPSPQLLEILEGHTPPADTARHTSYLRFLLQDIPRFSTWAVLFNVQYQASERRSRYATAKLDGTRSAARAMQTVYVMTAAALCEAIVLSSNGTEARGHRASTNGAAHTKRVGSHEGHVPALAHGVYDHAGELHRQLRKEAEASASHVQAWILTDPSSLDRRGGRHNLLPSSPTASASAGPLKMRDVKAMLARDAGQVSRDDGDSEGGEEKSTSSSGDGDADALSGRPSPRRAKLQLPVLLHHIWTTTLNRRSPQQRCTALWSVCAATLLGLSSSALHRSRMSGRSGNFLSDGAAADAVEAEGDDYARLALHHSYVAAGVLMRHHAPEQQSAHYIDATIRALLLSRVLEEPDQQQQTRFTLSTASTGASPAASSSTSQTPSKGEWPMLLSSARTPTVSTLCEFLVLQRTLAASILAVNEDDMHGATASTQRAELQALLNAFASIHGPPPPDVQLRPAWRLFEPLQCHPHLATCWIADTFLHPSPAFLVWLVGAITRTDAAAYAALHTWLTHLPAGHRVSTELRATLVQETLRRQRGALTRQRHYRSTQNL